MFSDYQQVFIILFSVSGTYIFESQDNYLAFLEAEGE